MWIFRFRQILRNVFRFLNILGIILKYQFHKWFTTGVFGTVFDPKGKRRMSRSERFRRIIEDLGPTYIKFGQILADRPDLISENLRRELKKLQSSARPFDDDHAIAIVERELGDTIENVFAEFNREYIAAASIAQVYSAVLHSGEKVVLKVQRPGIRSKIKLDIILIRILANRIQRSFPELASFNIVAFIDDFGDTVLKELDFSNEISNMMRFKHMFAGDERCYIPKVYSEFCTPRLLVMEFIEGVEPESANELKEKGYDPQIIAENGINIILTMILRHGFFHADPHAGNLFIRGNNQIVMLDHGMCASLKPKQIDGLVNFLIGFSEKNSHKIVKSLLKLTQVQYLKDSEDLEFDIDELIQKYSYVSYDKVDISGLFTDTFKLLMKYEIKIPTNLYMLLKTLVTIQKVAESLNADLNLIDMIKPYAREKIMEKFSWDNIKQKVVNSAEDYLYFIEHFPRDVKEIVTSFKNKGLRHNITLDETGSTNKQIRNHVYLLGSYVLIGVLVICATLLKIFNVQKVVVKGKVVDHQMFGEYPNYFFTVVVVIASFMMVRLFLRKKGIED